MSISSRITAMQEHLQDDYDVLELAGADLTNVDKNIVNLKPTWKERLLYFINNGTDEVYDNWDKVTGEGTSLTLNNTLEAKMKIVLKGNTSQEGTPTPTSPQDIHVVSGDNSIEVCGKNLFSGDYSQFTNTGGTGTIYDYFKLPDDNKQYTLTVIAKNDFTATGSTFLGFTANGGNGSSSVDWVISQGSGTIAKGTILSKTSTSNRRYVSLYSTGASSLKNFTDNFYIQLEEGSTATTYEAFKGASYPINLPVENLLDLNDVVNGYLTTVSLLPNGFSATGNWYVAYPFNLGNGTYTLNYNFEVKSGTGDSTSGKIRIKYTDNTYSQYYSMPYTFNTDKEIDSILFYVRQGGDTITGDFTNVQLEKGNKKNRFVPYGTTPIELCKIGTYQDKIDKSSGKNLFDGVFELGIIGGTNGADMANNDYIRGKNYIPVKELTNYKFSTDNQNITSVYVYEYKEDFSYNLTTNKVVQLNSYLTTNSGTKYIRFRPGYQTTDTSLRFMLNEGTTALPYEPYGTDWYLKKEIGKVVLDGSETWTQGTVSSQVYWYTNLPNSINGSTRMADVILSNYFTPNSQNSVDGFYLTNNNIIIFNHGIASTVADFKTWLGTHNTVIDYVLQTPTYETITDTTLLSQLEAIKKSYNNQTNISQENNDLASILNASALENM